MKTTESIGKLCEALAKAQGKFENPPRNRKVHVATKTGAGYDFHYATLDRILEQVRPILSENGLAIIQAAETKDGRVVVTSRLGHLSGEWIESELSLRPEDDDPQKCGSAITYGKRYLLTSMLGISADEDDDGNHASGNHVEKAEERPACPACGTNKSVIIGKPEYGGGFVCFAKKGGCGNKWQAATKEADPFGGEPEQPKANGKKVSADVPAHPSIKTGAQLEAEQAAFDAWADMLVKSTPATHDATLKTLKRAIGDGRLTSDFTFKIICRALERASKPEHLEGIEKLMKPLIEAAKIPERDSLKFAELLPAAEDRIGVTVTT